MPAPLPTTNLSLSLSFSLSLSLSISLSYFFSAHPSQQPTNQAVNLTFPMVWFRKSFFFFERERIVKALKQLPAANTALSNLSISSWKQKQNNFLYFPILLSLFEVTKWQGNLVLKIGKMDK